MPDIEVSQKEPQMSEAENEEVGSALIGAQADKIIELAAERTKHTRVSRRKSRDESTFAGRVPVVRKA